MADQFSERLQQARRKKGLQPGDLADKAGISRERLKALENGKVAPTDEELHNLAVVLEVSDQYLTEGGINQMSTQGNTPDDVASALAALGKEAADRTAQTKKSGGFISPEYLKQQAAQQAAAKAQAQRQQQAPKQAQSGKRLITREQLGMIMKETRQARNWSYNQIIGQLGISLGDYILIEMGNDQVHISSELFTKIKNLFGI